MGRRDSDDKQWQSVKEEVRRRDRVDRIFKILNAKEAFVLRRNGSIQLQTLDPAHIIPVSSNSEIMYEACNIVLLNRFSHEMLDNCRNPVTGEHISRRERENWWVRILKGNPKQFEEFKTLLKEKDIYFEGLEEL